MVNYTLYNIKKCKGALPINHSADVFLYSVKTPDVNLWESKKGIEVLLCCMEVKRGMESTSSILLYHCSICIHSETNPK